MVEEAIFDLGETAIIECVIKDADTLVLTSPTTVKITIVTGGVTKKDQKDMAEDSTGNYHYDYLTADSGRHYVTIEADQVSAVRITIDKNTFMVI